MRQETVRKDSTLSIKIQQLKIGFIKPMQGDPASRTGESNDTGAERHLHNHVDVTQHLCVCLFK